MTSDSEIVKDDKGYTVNVYCGSTRYVYGPYRYEWFANFIAWWNAHNH